MLDWIVMWMFWWPKLLFQALTTACLACLFFFCRRARMAVLKTEGTCSILFVCAAPLLLRMVPTVTWP